MMIVGPNIVIRDGGDLARLALGRLLDRLERDGCIDLRPGMDEDMKDMLRDAFCVATAERPAEEQWPKLGDQLCGPSRPWGEA